MHNNLFILKGEDISDTLLKTAFYNILGKEISLQYKIRRKSTKNNNYIIIGLTDSTNISYFSLLQERQKEVQLYIERYKPIWLEITKKRTHKY